MLRRSPSWFVLILSGTFLLAGCKSMVGTRTDDQKAEYELEQRAKAHAHYAAGVIHDLNNESVLALQEYYLAVQGDPHDESLVMEVSLRFILNKQLDKALEILSRTAKYPDASGQIYARLGYVYLQLGETNLALAGFQNAIRKSPQLIDGYQNLYALQIQGKHPDAALAVLDGAAIVGNTDAGFLTSLGELYLDYSRQIPTDRASINQKARNVFIRALDLNPAELEMRLRLAEDFGLVNDADHVAEIYRKLLPELAASPALQASVRTRLANIYLRTGDQKLAFEQLEAIVQDDPSNPQVYYFLGSLAFDQKEMQKAAEYFSKAVFLKPDFEPAYYDYASATLNLDQPTNTLAMLGRAREVFPQNFMMEYLAGVAHSQLKDYPAALTNFTTAEIIAAAKEPQRLTGGFYFDIAAACERVGNIAEAEAYFLKCLDLQPDNDEAMNYLGYMWADHEMKLDRARELIEKALKAEPDNDAYLDSMGWVLFKIGQPEQALGYIQRAVAATSEPDPELLDHLGDVYGALKEMDKAVDAWKKSNAARPNDEVARKITDATPK